MTDEVFSIGQVAERTGLSVHTLRLYERQGLLTGEVRRDPAGRRVYSSWDVAWLTNCVLFRVSGMPLATIRRLAQLVAEGSGNEQERLEVLRSHRQLVRLRMTELGDCLDLIETKVASYEVHLAAGDSGDPWQPDA